jgi:hypothetical protein
MKAKMLLLENEDVPCRAAVLAYEGLRQSLTSDEH